MKRLLALFLLLCSTASAEEVTFEFDYAPEANVTVDEAELRFLAVGKTITDTPIMTHRGAFTTSTDPNWREITANVPPGIYTVAVRVFNSEGGLPSDWYIHPTPISTIKPSAPGGIRIKVNVQVEVGDVERKQPAIVRRENISLVA